MTSTARKAGVALCRTVQVALVGLAAILIIGSLLGGMNVITFAAIGVFALVLLGFAGVTEGLVRVLRGRAGASEVDG